MSARIATAPEAERPRRWLPGCALFAQLLFGCGGPEHEVVHRFLLATQRGDNQTVAALSMVAFPEEDVTDWDIIDVSDTTTAPYRLPELRRRVEETEDARDEQFQIFGRFRRENYDDLARIQRRLREEPDQRLSGRLRELQEEWDAFRAERREVVARLREAQQELEREIRRVTKSLQRESSPEYLTGETRRRDVRVRVTTASGERLYRVALTRYELENQFGAVVPSRWIITGVEEIEGGPV